MKTNPRLQRLTDAEYARLESQSKPARLARSFAYSVQRIAIRALRILGGLALAAIALWCGALVVELLRTPLAALTLGGIMQLAFTAIGAFVAGLSAFFLAFGEAPSRPTLTEEAEARARQQLELADEREKVAHWYRRSHFVGLLFDPTLAKRHRWLPWVAAIGAYAILGLVVALVAHFSS